MSLLVVGTNARSTGMGLVHTRWPAMLCDKVLEQRGVYAREFMVRSSRIDALRYNLELFDLVEQLSKRGADTLTVVLDVGVSDALNLDGSEPSSRKDTSARPAVLCRAIRGLCSHLEKSQPSVDMRFVLAWNDGVYDRVPKVTKAVTRQLAEWAKADPDDHAFSVNLTQVQGGRKPEEIGLDIVELLWPHIWTP